MPSGMPPAAASSGMSLRFSRWIEQYSDRQSWNALRMFSSLSEPPNWDDVFQFLVVALYAVAGIPWGLAWLVRVPFALRRGLLFGFGGLLGWIVR